VPFKYFFFIYYIKIYIWYNKTIILYIIFNFGIINIIKFLLMKFFFYHSNGMMGINYNDLIKIIHSDDLAF